jgi:hypothetical protein
VRAWVGTPNSISPQGCDRSLPAPAMHACRRFWPMPTSPAPRKQAKCDVPSRPRPGLPAICWAAVRATAAHSSSVAQLRVCNQGTRPTQRPGVHERALQAGDAKAGVRMPLVCTPWKRPTLPKEIRTPAAMALPPWSVHQRRQGRRQRGTPGLNGSRAKAGTGHTTVCAPPAALCDTCTRGWRKRGRGRAAGRRWPRSGSQT